MAKLYLINGRIFREDSEKLSLLNGRILKSNTAAGGGSDTEVQGIVHDLVLDDTALATIAVDHDILGITHALILDDTELAEIGYVISGDIEVVGITHELVLDDTALATIANDVNVQTLPAVSSRELISDADLNDIGEWSGSAVGKFTATGVLTGTGLVKFDILTNSTVPAGDYEIRLTVDSIDGTGLVISRDTIEPLISIDASPRSYIERVTTTSAGVISLVRGTGTATSIVISEFSWKQVGLEVASDLATISVDHDIQCITHELVLDDTELATIANDVNVQTIVHDMVLDDTALADIESGINVNVEGITHELVLDDTKLATITRNHNVQCITDVLYISSGLADVNGSIERNKPRTGWDIKKRDVNLKYKAWKDTRKEQQDSDAAFMRMLLGEELQEGESLVVDDVMDVGTKKVRIRLDTTDALEGLQPALEAAVPFPVIVERMPRHKKKRRVITKEVVQRDDAEVMRRLFDII
jgi:hypothetical protein